MKYVVAQEGVVIPLGRQDENKVETVIFQTSTWPDQYGEGAFQLVHKRATDSAPYPCSITVSEGNVLWPVESADVFVVGFGCAQLTYVVNEAIAKSVIFSTSTLPSLGGGASPEPTPSWLQRVYEIGDSVEEAETIALNAEAWAVGQRGGIDVPDTDPTYHNNAKDWAKESENSANDSLEYSDAAQNSAEAAALSAQQAAAFVGAPLQASTVAGMTDHTKVYVYTGSEAGYTLGHWYYWNGTAWADGGIYNAIAVDIATSADLQAALYS